jgi:hypothetical protein
VHFKEQHGRRGVPASQSSTACRPLLPPEQRVSSEEEPASHSQVARGAGAWAAWASWSPTPTLGPRARVSQPHPKRGLTEEIDQNLRGPEQSNGLLPSKLQSHGEVRSLDAAGSGQTAPATASTAVSPPDVSKLTTKPAARPSAQARCASQPRPTQPGPAQPCLSAHLRAACCAGAVGGH